MNLSLLTSLAHAGHPGPESHSFLTHFLLGLGLALPLLAGALFWLGRHRPKSERAKKSPRQD